MSGLGSSQFALTTPARALHVDIGSFFEGIEPGVIRRDEPTPQQQLLMALVRNVVAIPVRRHQEEILALARALAEPAARRRQGQPRLRSLPGTRA
jgi:hypothetical protein